ncbi:ATP-binding response regulator [Phreatobacter sp.]|uniref:ATP-binding response regulator n=1 Tax=Phreatobacter sp. TaxID=1966341 RepID=UPI003F6F7EEA
MTSIWLSLTLLALAHGLQGSVAGASMAVMVLLFALSLSVAAALMQRFLEQRAVLIEQLGEQNDQLRTLAGELAEAQSARLRFLAQASHDIRQPIHAISLFVECLKTAGMSAEDRGILGQIDRSLKGLALLCRSLLDLSALDVGRIRLAPSDLPLQDLIDDVLRQAGETAREQNVRLRSRPSPLWVHADPALLHNMLQNLVSNAVKYAPGGTVLVAARHVGGRIAVDVVDTGGGIRTEDQARVFDEFVRLAGRENGAIEGLGLGLTIVQRLAHMMGLVLTLRSWPGRGTRFRIGGLRASPAPARPRESPTDRYTRQLEGLRVLVIDDDPAVLLATTRLLARWGCVVLPMDIVPETESRAPGRDFDLVLCDENSGRSSGLAYIAEVKKRWHRAFPAIVVTGQDVERLRADPGARGIHVLSKPLNAARLRSLLQSLHADSRIEPLDVR